ILLLFLWRCLKIPASIAAAIDAAPNANSSPVTCVVKERIARTAEAVSKITLAKKRNGMRRILLFYPSLFQQTILWFRANDYEEKLGERLRLTISRITLQPQ